MSLPTVDGEIVTTGVLYRFIPNRDTLWEYDRERPSPRAFRRRADEADVSMYLDGLTNLAKLQALQPKFGICAVPIEELVSDPAVSVVYKPEFAIPEGSAKVAVLGINRRRAERIARELATIANAPSTAETSIGNRSDDDDAPADRWRSEQ